MTDTGEITVNYIEDDSAVAVSKKKSTQSPIAKRKLPETYQEENESSTTEPSLEKRPRKAQGGFGGNTAGVWKGHQSSIFGKNPEIPKIHHADVNPVSEPVFSATSFAEVGVHPFLVSNLKQHFQIELMTEIQRRAIPAVLTGQDVLIKSQTGSGKTLTYVVPILHKMQEIEPKISREHGCYALIIVPSRELAQQTYEWLRVLCRSFARIVPGVLTGGEKRKSEKARIRKGINILVTTPGRLLDHASHTVNITFNRVQWLVLDEADRLTDMGYERDIAEVIQALNDQQSAETSRQTVLLSATLTPAVERLAGLTMKNRMFVDIGDCEEEKAQQSAFALPANLKHHYVVVPAKLRLVSLLSFLLDKTCLGTDGKVIVFMGTQDMVDYHCDLITRIFAGAGGRDSKLEVNPDELEDDEGLLEGLELDNRPRQAISAFIARLHGSMEQKDRTAIFNRFRDAKTGILLCTDVASRGLDLPKVHWIVQYNAPTSIEDYIHRVGRTARVGNKGAALIFLEPNECGYIKNLEEQQIKLKELSGEEMLTRLLLIDDSICPGRSMEQRATMLQVTAESLVSCDKDLHDKARRAYSTFVSFYATYPRASKSVFCHRTIHLGHYAKSFALRDTPSELARAGRRRAEKMMGKETKASPLRRAKGTRAPLPSRHSKTGFTTKVVGAQRIKKFSKPVSEFDSGLDVIASEHASGRASKGKRTAGSMKKSDYSVGKKKMRRF